MSKKLSRAEVTFHRDRKEQIQKEGSETEPSPYFWKEPTNKPIFIPKRKKEEVMGDMADYYRDLEFEAYFDNMCEKKTYELWSLESGDTIPVSQMSVSHLKNCIAKIEREHWRKDWHEHLAYELSKREKDEKTL